MKSSSISLLYKDFPIKQKFDEELVKKSDNQKVDFCQPIAESDKEKVDYAINIIDSPGHIAFAFEVSSGLKVCDGALLIIDVIEGVCS